MKATLNERRESKRGHHLLEYQMDLQENVSEIQCVTGIKYGIP